MPARYHIILAREAVSDLQSLHDYIARDSPGNAAKIVERILKSIFSLDSFPHRNLAERRSQKIKYPVRSLVAKPYIIYFRVIEPEKVVRVLTVRHGARRKPSRFG